MRTWREPRIGRHCEKRGGGWRARAAARRAAGGGGGGASASAGGSLVTDENMQKLRDLNGVRGTDAMVQSTLREFDEAVPEAKTLIQQAIDNGEFKGTGIEDRISTSIAIANGRRVRNNEIGMLSDIAMNATATGGNRGSIRGQDHAERALAIQFSQGAYPRLREGQRNRLAYNLQRQRFFEGNGVSRLGSAGQDLQRRANLVENARRRADDRRPLF